MCLLSGADADLPESGRDWVRLGSSRDCSELCLLAGVEQHRKYLPPNSQPLQDDDRQRVFEQICIRRWNSQTNLQLHEHENLCKWVSLCFLSSCIFDLPCRVYIGFLTWVEPTDSNGHCCFWHLHHQQETSWDGKEVHFYFVSLLFCGCCAFEAWADTECWA